MSEELTKCLSELDLRMNTIKRVTIRNLHHKILGDPFLWLRLKQPASEEPLSHPFEQRLAGTKSTGDCFSKRVHCFKRGLQKEVDGKSQAQHLREFLSENKSPKEGELRNVLFPDSLQFILPDVTATSNIPPQCDAVQVPLGSANLPRGIVTDLYESAGDDWEGFINAVYRFTSASCHCACPVYLGCVVEFQLTPESKKSASLVVDRSLKVLEYIPGTLPSEYATDYLKELEQSSDPLRRIHRIRQLPGPFAALLNEPELFQAHQSKIIAILASVSGNEGSGSDVTVLHMLHTSNFIRELPLILVGKYTLINEGKGVVKTTKGDCKDVELFLRLVTVCVQSFPDVAYQLISVIWGCAQLAFPFEREFTAEASNFCRAVIHACSVVRQQDVVTSSKESSSFETSEGPEKRLFDPLLWVSCFFSESVAQLLRELLPQKPLSGNEEVVDARRRFENIIQCSASKLSKEHLQKGLKVRKNISLFSSHHDSKLAAKRGVVIDLYEGVGYIALALSRGYPSRVAQNQQIFRIEESTTTFVGASSESLQSLHIGDVVTFQVSPDSPNKVHIIVRVIQYCSAALDKAFSKVLFPPHRDSHYVEHVFCNEAAIRGILNAPQVYKNAEVASALIDAAMDTLSDPVSPSIKKKMLNLLKSSSFVRELIEIAPHEASKSAKVLQPYLAEFPNEICILAPTLNALVSHLLEQGKLQELATFVSCLCTTPCILPPSIEIEQQPWQNVPTILTAEEWKSGAIANKEYLPKVKERGSYSSVDEYGRTYFLLLRADCHGNLASAIAQLREPASSAKRGTEVEIPVCDASITGLSKGTGHHLVYRFNIESRPTPSECFSKDTPLFKAGNLLCFSIGGRFEDDIVWATINHIESYVHTRKTSEGDVKSVRLDEYMYICINNGCTHC